MELHLVPDTNLFFEFKLLEQLPWDELRADPIVLLLTKPVLDEIDRHKKDGGRTRDRALDIFGRFRAMLTAGLADAAIRAAGPRVVLRRATGILPDPALKEHLDYDRADERLIGIVSALSKQATGYEVKLFTDDGGPAGMALDLGVPYAMIPQAWRRPLADSTEAKQLKEARKDLAMYRSQEPKIAIRCETADADGFVKVVNKVATPLTEPEVNALIEALRLKHPPRSDFTPPPIATSTDTWGETTTVEYSTPSEDDIANYRDVRYPGWVETCRQTLRGLHVGRDEAAPVVLLRWAMSNDGSRPAKDVRVEFATGGHLVLQRSDASDDDEADAAPSGKQSSTNLASGLPLPPKPPAFGEKVTRAPPPAKPGTLRGVSLSSLRGIPSPAMADYLRAMEAARGLASPTHRLFEQAHSAAAEFRHIQDTVKGFAGLDATLRSTLVDPIVTPRLQPIRGLSLHSLRPPEPPKPEEFLYDSWPRKRSVLEGALTCQLWRHQTGDEIFEFTVRFVKNGEARGVVDCTVHADNLTELAQARVIIERTVEAVGTLDRATTMVDACG
jgi:hypothetical protein